MISKIKNIISRQREIRRRRKCIEMALQHGIIECYYSDLARSIYSLIYDVKTPFGKSPE